LHIRSSLEFKPQKLLDLSAGNGCWGVLKTVGTTVPLDQCFIGGRSDAESEVPYPLEFLLE